MFRFLCSCAKNPSATNSLNSLHENVNENHLLEENKESDENPTEISSFWSVIHFYFPLHFHMFKPFCCINENKESEIQKEN